MRLKMTALVASALAGFLYMSAPSASALPAPSPGDVTTPGATKGSAIEEVRYRGRRGWRGYGYRRGYGGYRGYGYRRYGNPYGYYGYGPSYYGGYGGYGYPYAYRRRPGFGIYLGF